MGVPPMDVRTRTIDAKRRPAIAERSLPWSENAKSRLRGELDRAAPDVREYTHPWAGRPCYGGCYTGAGACGSAMFRGARPSSSIELSNTIPGVTRVMQRWSSGQTFFWHGPQNTFTATCRSFA